MLINNDLLSDLKQKKRKIDLMQLSLNYLHQVTPSRLQMIVGYLRKNVKYYKTYWVKVIWLRTQGN